MTCALGLGACGYPGLPQLGGDAGTADDGSHDATPGSLDARVCFGTSVPVCLAAPPMMPLTVTFDTKVDTSLPATCVATTSGGDGVCVVAATTITIGAELRGIGDLPLVLIASESITVTGPNGKIDVGNHRGNPDVGAGANPRVCMAGAGPRAGGASGSGGGAGGSFTGTGGTGGAGGVSAGGTGGAAAVGTANITAIRGGCPGQQGGSGSEGGAAGRGGGAVHLVAGRAIDIGGRGNQRRRGRRRRRVDALGGWRRRRIGRDHRTGRTHHHQQRAADRERRRRRRGHE